MSARESVERAATLAALIARHSEQPAHAIASHVLHLQRISGQLKAISERQCNGYQRPKWDSTKASGRPDMEWDEDAERRDKERHGKLTRRVADVLACALYGNPEVDHPPVKFTVGGDPRGCCLAIQIPGEPGDGWTRDQRMYAVY